MYSQFKHQVFGYVLLTRWVSRDYWDAGRGAAAIEAAMLLILQSGE